MTCTALFFHCCCQMVTIQDLNLSARFGNHLFNRLTTRLTARKLQKFTRYCVCGVDERALASYLFSAQQCMGNGIVKWYVSLLFENHFWPESVKVFMVHVFWISFSMYCFQHCFICRCSDSTVSEDAGIWFRTVATLALAVGRSNHWARSHPQLG
jgi:hypothetical protein